jgi:recombination protein RecR
MLTDADLCSICAAPARDASLLCVVESPADVVAVEQSGSYRGRYFVLHGHLSPLDGIGPEQLSIGKLVERAVPPVKEVLLALNATVDAHYNLVADLTS